MKIYNDPQTPRNIFNRHHSSNSTFPLPSRERARGHLNSAPTSRSSLVKGEKTNTSTDQVTIAIILAALLLFAATFARAASLDEMLAKRKPEATIDLATQEGVQLIKGDWRY